MNFAGEIYTGVICQIYYTNFLNMSSFLIADSILRMEALRVIVNGQLPPGLSFPRKFPWGGEFFLEGGARSLSTESEEKH
jgi:hypothetical protein